MQDLQGTEIHFLRGWRPGTIRLHEPNLFG